MVAAGLLLLLAFELRLAAGEGSTTFTGGLKINADVEVVPASFNAKAGIGVLGGGVWNELNPMSGTVTNWPNLVDAISGEPT
jgi:anti-sigma factor ChrR (cupin superfamily)